MKKGRTITIWAFIIIVVALVVAINLVPKLNDALTSTEIIEYGELQISEDATCYIVRDETVYTAPSDGDVTCLVSEGVQVKKGTEIIEFVSTGAGDPEASSQYTVLMESDRDSAVPASGSTSARKGLVSYYVDGCEDYFSPSNMVSLDKEIVESMKIEPVYVRRDSVLMGEPLYKITNNTLWYIAFWIAPESIANYEVGDSVTVQFGTEEFPADVYNIFEAEDGWLVLLSTNRYYSGFTSERVVEGKIITLDRHGLLVPNECITTRDGVVGVYVQNKAGDFNFVPVNVLASDGVKTLVSEGQFYDAEGNAVITVNNYDEVLRNPDVENTEPSDEEE